MNSAEEIFYTLTKEDCGFLNRLSNTFEWSHVARQNVHYEPDDRAGRPCTGCADFCDQCDRPSNPQEEESPLD